jgi:hypothetical protein
VGIGKRNTFLVIYTNIKGNQNEIKSAISQPPKSKKVGSMPSGSLLMHGHWPQRVFEIEWPQFSEYFLYNYVTDDVRPGLCLSVYENTFLPYKSNILCVNGLPSNQYYHVLSMG